MKLIKALPLVVSLLAPMAFGESLESKVEKLNKRIQELEAQQKADKQSLVDEMSNIKTETAVPELANKSFGGLGNGASKVYYSKSRLSIGGYGEVKYSDIQGGKNTTDVHRFIPYIGYRFNDNIVFNSEIEFEHGGAYKGAGEAIVEFAYLDFLFSESLNFRVGHVLVPVGLVNLRHEPTLFEAVERPEVEKYIVPSTWHENGFLLHGQTSAVRYTLGMVNGFDSSGFSKKDWLRSGRQGGKGDSDTAEDFAYTGRAEFVGVDGLNVGGSFYMGKSAQANSGPDGDVSIYTVHAEWMYNNLTLRGLYATGALEDGNQIVSGIGEGVNGYYVTLAYDFMPLIVPTSDKALILFARHSNYDLNAEVAEGVTRDDSLNKTRTTFGLNYRPVANVALKLDYQMRKTEAAEEDDIVKFGLGFVF